MAAGEAAPRGAWLPWGAVAIASFAPLVAGGNAPSVRTLFAALCGVLLAAWLPHLWAARGEQALPICGALPALAWVTWVLLSLLPLPADLLARLAPAAAELRADGAVAVDAAVPLSLAPGHTFLALAHCVAAWVVYAVIATCVRRRATARAVLVALVMVAALEAGIGLGERFLQHASPGAPITGTFVNQNHLAFLLVLGLLAGIGILLEGAVPRDLDRGALPPSWGTTLGDARLWRALSFAVVLAFLAAALVLTTSRGAAIACLLGLGLVAVVLLLRRGRAGAVWAGLLVVGATATVAWVGTAALAERFTFGVGAGAGAGASESPQVRIDTWAGTVRMVQALPLAGVGLGAFAEVYPAFKSPRFPQFYLVHSHCDPLELGAETGVLGALLLAWLALALAARIVRRLRAGADLLYTGVVAAVAAGAAHSLVDFPLHVPGDLFWYAVLAGLAAAPDWESAVAPARPPARWARYMVAAIAALPLFLGGALTTAAAWGLRGFYQALRQEAPTLGISPRDPRLTGTGMEVLREELPRFRPGTAETLVADAERSARLSPWLPEFDRLAGRLLACAAEAPARARAERAALLERGAAHYRQAIALDPARAHFHLEYGWLLERLRGTSGGEAAAQCRAGANQEFARVLALSHDPPILEGAAAYWQGRMRDTQALPGERAQARAALLAAESVLLAANPEGLGRRIRTLWEDLRSYEFLREAIARAGLGETVAARRALAFALGRSGMYAEAEMEQRAVVALDLGRARELAVEARRRWEAGDTVGAAVSACIARVAGAYLVVPAAGGGAPGPAPAWLEATAVLALLEDRRCRGAEARPGLGELARWVGPGADGGLGDLAAPVAEVARRAGGGRSGGDIAAELERFVDAPPGAGVAVTLPMESALRPFVVEGAGYLQGELRVASVPAIRLVVRVVAAAGGRRRVEPPLNVSVEIEGLAAGAGYLEAGYGEVIAEARVPRGGARLWIRVRRLRVDGAEEAIGELDLADRVRVRVESR